VELKGRLKAAQAALSRIEQLYTEEKVPLDAQEPMREHYEERIRRYEAALQAGETTEEYAESSATWRDWQRELLTAEREAIVSMRDQGQLPPEIMRRIQRDLDLEEARIGR